MRSTANSSVDPGKAVSVHRLMAVSIEMVRGIHNEIFMEKDRNGWSWEDGEEKNVIGPTARGCTNLLDQSPDLIISPWQGSSSRIYTAPSHSVFPHLSARIVLHKVCDTIDMLFYGINRQFNRKQRELLRITHPRTSDSISCFVFHHATSDILRTTTCFFSAV